jgi:hypothetical protein
MPKEHCKGLDAILDFAEKSLGVYNPGPEGEGYDNKYQILSQLEAIILGDESTFLVSELQGYDVSVEESDGDIDIDAELQEGLNSVVEFADRIALLRVAGTDMTLKVFYRQAPILSQFRSSDLN